MQKPLNNPVQKQNNKLNANKSVGLLLYTNLIKLKGDLQMPENNITDMSNQGQANAAGNAETNPTSEPSAHQHTSAESIAHQHPNPVTPTADQKAAAFKVFATQADFDNAAAAIRHNAKESAEREAEKNFLALLGLTPEDKGKLETIRKTYEDSLTEQEKANQVLQTLQANYAALKAQTDDKDVTIQVLSKISGKSSTDIVDVVKMAKAITSETLPIEAAIEKVMTMIVPQSTQADYNTSAAHQPALPKGMTLQQPNTNINTNADPKNLSEALTQMFNKK